VGRQGYGSIASSSFLVNSGSSLSLPPDMAAIAAACLLPLSFDSTEHNADMRRMKPNCVLVSQIHEPRPSTTDSHCRIEPLHRYTKFYGVTRANSGTNSMREIRYLWGCGALVREHGPERAVVCSSQCLWHLGSMPSLVGVPCPLRGVGGRWQGQAAEAAPEVGAAVAVESHRAGAGEELQNGSSPWLAVAFLWLGAAGETRRTGGDEWEGRICQEEEDEGGKG
jgi:hypothetical protein